MKKNNAALFIPLFLSASLFGIAHAGESCQLPESDSDGDGWGWEADASCRITEHTGKTPEVTHPRTGEAINIERIFWVWEDFNNKTISECQGYIVDPDQSADICSTCRGPAATYFHGTDGVGRFSTAIGTTGENSISLNTPADKNQNEDDDDNATTPPEEEQPDEVQAEQEQVPDNSNQNTITASFKWNVDNLGFYAGALDIAFFGERTTSGVRFWQEGEAGRIGFYTLCEVNPSSMQTIVSPPTTTAPVNPANVCTDFDGDGWGWDGTQTCIP